MKGILGAGLSLPPGHVHKEDRQSVAREYLSTTGEWMRVVFMGVLLGAVILTVWWSDGSAPSSDPANPAITAPRTATPELDATLLATIKDDTRTARIQVEPLPLAHLLEKSANVVPAVARALGMPAEPVALAVLRQNPDRWRGKYLWYKGTLAELPRATPTIFVKESITRRAVFEARVATPEGEQVLCAFSTPPPEGLKVGDWVRVEGFFMKLRDQHFPSAVDQAAFLVGPELARAFEDWAPVTKLDPQILAQVRDGKLVDTVDGDGTKLRPLVGDAGDATVSLDHAQSFALWHIASYAIEQARGLTAESVNKLPRLLSQEQWRTYVYGNAPKGETVSIVGTLQIARTIEARPNPLGVDHWTEAWVQVRELQGRVLPIWIPKAIDGWSAGAPVIFAGHFYKLTRYASADLKEHVAPCFVAAELFPYKLPDHPLAHYLNVPVVIFLLLLIAFTIWFARRNRRQEIAAERDLVARRRKHRGAPPIGATS